MSINNIPKRAKDMSEDIGEMYSGYECAIENITNYITSLVSGEVITEENKKDFLSLENFYDNKIKEFDAFMAEINIKGGIDIVKEQLTIILNDKQD